MMLTIRDHLPTHHCQGYSRREFLRVGAIGAGACSLAGLLQAKSHAAGLDILRGRSVVLLFLQGGPPHIEFFDPKLTAPAEIHSVTGEVQTKLPGITFGSTFPKLAAMADRFTILHTLFDVGRLRLEPQVPREIIRFADTAQPIDQLLRS